MLTDDFGPWIELFKVELDGFLDPHISSSEHIAGSLA
jgi:hypothetical protein